MKLINQSAEILHQAPGLDGVYKHVELAGRTCYKSLDKITETSAKDFVDRMIKSNHFAMLEAGTVYLKIPAKKKTIIQSRPNHIGRYEEYKEHEWEYQDKKYIYNAYSKVYRYDLTNQGYNNAIPISYVSTNYRVIIENNWLDDLKYLCEPIKYHEKRITFRLITSRHIAMEAIRHKNLCRLIVILGQ